MHWAHSRLLVGVHAPRLYQWTGHAAEQFLQLGWPGRSWYCGCTGDRLLQATGSSVPPGHTRPMGQRMTVPATQ